MKKEATLGTTVKWRENELYALVAFCVIWNLISKLQIMLVTEVFDFYGYFNSILSHSDFYDFENFWVKELMELWIFRFWLGGLLLFKFPQIYVLLVLVEHNTIKVGNKIASWAIVKVEYIHFSNTESTNWRVGLMDFKRRGEVERVVVMINFQYAWARNV